MVGIILYLLSTVYNGFKIVFRVNDEKNEEFTTSEEEEKIIDNDTVKLIKEIHNSYETNTNKNENNEKVESNSQLIDSAVDKFNKKLENVNDKPLGDTESIGVSTLIDTLKSNCDLQETTNNDFKSTIIIEHVTKVQISPTFHTDSNIDSKAKDKNEIDSAFLEDYVISDSVILNNSNSFDDSNNSVGSNVPNDKVLDPSTDFKNTLILNDGATIPAGNVDEFFTQIIDKIPISNDNINKIGNKDFDISQAPAKTATTYFEEKTRDINSDDISIENVISLLKEDEITDITEKNNFSDQKSQNDTKLDATKSSNEIIRANNIESKTQINETLDSNLVKSKENDVVSTEEVLFISNDDLKKLLRSYSEVKELTDKNNNSTNLVENQNVQNDLTATNRSYEKQDSNESQDTSRNKISQVLIDATHSINKTDSFTSKETKTSKPNKPAKLSLKDERHVYNLKHETSDTMDYRLGYPGLRDNPKLSDNLSFLTGKIKSRPDGDYINNIHEKWSGDYNKLKQHNGYIQWLFPIRIQGVNYDSHALQKHEIDKLKSKENKELLEQNLLKSFKMMLDFYGMQLISVETGKIERSKNYLERYENLIRNPLNNFQITRILKCLGEFDLEIYQIELIEFLLHEVFETKELKALNDALTRYWIHTVKDDEKRNELIEKAINLIIDNIE